MLISDDVIKVYRYSLTDIGVLKKDILNARKVDSNYVNNSYIQPFDSEYIDKDFNLFLAYICKEDDLNSSQVTNKCLYYSDSQNEQDLCRIFLSYISEKEKELDEYCFIKKCEYGKKRVGLYNYFD